MLSPETTEYSSGFRIAELWRRHRLVAALQAGGNAQGTPDASPIASRAVDYLSKISAMRCADFRPEPVRTITVVSREVTVPSAMKRVSAAAATALVGSA